MPPEEGGKGPTKAMRKDCEATLLASGVMASVMMQFSDGLLGH
jgi:hypothetical protein